MSYSAEAGTHLRAVYEARLDPGVAQALLGMTDTLTVDVDRIGELRTARAASFRAPDPRLRHQDIEVLTAAGGQFPLRIHRPDDDSCLPCIYWIHGGGYMFGSFRADEDRVDAWVDGLSCAVVTPDYRLAPEHPYPTPLNDCVAGLDWVMAHADEVGIDSSRIIVAGASAGGGLAAALCLFARDRGDPLIRAQVLLYPMLDDRFRDYPSSLIWTPRWGAAANVAGWEAYLGSQEHASPRRYAVAGREENLRGMPTSFISVAELDVLRDEAIRFASRLVEADVPTELHLYRGAPHGFDRSAPESVPARRMSDDLLAFLRAELG
jgi:acetyl esterase/lipase